MKKLRYGEEYQYSHDAPGHFVEQQYLPDTLAQAIFYRPSDEGEERTIKERLNAWWKRRRGRL
jgi:putative ATPase